MANDENLAVRVSILEMQMATLLEVVEEIRAHYVTREYLDQRLEQRLAAFKTELMAELNPRFAALEVRIDQCATKEELRQLELRMELRMSQMERRLRNWMLGLFFTLFFSLAGMQYAMFQHSQH